MNARAAVILIEDGRVALIERHRQGLHYYTFPGGHLDPGETPEQAAVREAWEELGLRVALGRLLATGHWQGQEQFYFLAQAAGGLFGTGTGEELHRPRPERGRYTPVWLPLTELLTRPVLPRPLAELVARSPEAGWPDPAPELQED